MVVLLLVFGVLFRISYGDGELGSFKSDVVGAYEDFSIGAPLVIRVVTATVDPPVDPARPSDRFKSISVTITLPDNLSTVAGRLDGDHFVFLGTGSGRFRDGFPSECFRATCTRTYVLAACWTKPAAAGSMSVFMGAEIMAGPDGTTPSSVTMIPTPDLLPHDMAVDLAKATGCEGHA